ncbi:MAG: hypothetical protein JWO82_2204, partial [Akkermansiaceae bacterium]|nr:hypothetical protein [Akkermansiaceae bacterium]
MIPKSSPSKAFAAALALALPLGSASAVVLFTDNFSVTANMNDTNFDLANPGRQGGTLATPTLSYSDLAPGGYEQVGNTTTFAGNPNALLLDNGGTTYINYNFAAVTSAISISFDRIIASGNPDLSDWVSLQVNGAAGAGPGVTGADFGILFRGNGGTQLFQVGQGGVDGASGTNTGYGVFTNYTVVLSDLAGTGSAFGTGGSLVTYYEGSTLLGSQTL